MARIPDAFIDALLLARTGRYRRGGMGARVPLKRQGKEYVHRRAARSTTSARPRSRCRQTKQFYHCFGCGAHGTAISFLMNYDRLEFLDAVDELAKRVGMEIPRDTQQRNANPDTRDLYGAMEAASTFFRSSWRTARRRAYVEAAASMRRSSHALRDRLRARWVFRTARRAGQRPSGA
jgi:DNA primase